LKSKKSGNLAFWCELLTMDELQILVRFRNKETEQRALGKLIPRFSGKSWKTGVTAVPSAALGYLAEEGISFEVIGPAPYELLASLRDPGAAAVQ
jgi:hypothetical protein